MKNESSDYRNFLPSLDPVDTSSLPDKVEVKLIRYFLENNMKPGDSIPKELTLAETLGVSRTVVREALLRLRLTGLIESKKRRGAVLSNPDLFSLLQRTLYPTMMDDGTLRDIFEMRLVMEVGMADLIMERKTAKDITELKEIVQHEPRETSENLFEINQEIKFHGKLYEMAGNKTLMRFQRMLLPVFQYVNESGILKKKITPKSYVSHNGIIEAIENGTAEELRKAMRNHFENHYQRLF